MSPRVLVLAGGLSPEREVSLRSGRRVADALLRAGLEVTVADADAGLIPRLERDPPDVIFPLLHGVTGEDGALRSVLELTGVPYVGTRADACALAFDKPLAKTAVARAGVATPAALALPHSTFRELGSSQVLRLLIDRLPPPLMVKPTRGGSALGAVRVEAAGDLPAALVSCYGYGDVALVERFVPGTEVAVSVLETVGGLVALPPVEVVAVSGVYDYTARYTAGETEYFAPARLPEDVAERAVAAARLAHETLGLAHLSRTDLVVEPDGAVQFLEVNVAPGMTETSLLPMAVVAAGLDLADVCRDLVELALHDPATAGA